jgi:hypothetical protein
MPTAEGTEGVTDCAIIARKLEAIGRKIMKWPEPNVAKKRRLAFIRVTRLAPWLHG